ncbi:hypothetical protein BDV98DRAFT_558767, partial [Pterulicium gracile]
MFESETRPLHSNLKRALFNLGNTVTVSSTGCSQAGGIFAASGLSTCSPAGC